MTNPTMEALSERLNVHVTPSMKGRVLALMAKQGRRTEADVVRAALTAYLNKEEKR
jgi:Arc/MetJ-type ribon-helix-helix transcriptional regulator